MYSLLPTIIFGHNNIRLPEYSDRPFDSVEEMDEALIERWNELVKPQDTIYHLGDFVYWRLSLGKMNSYVRRLNGHKHLIFGNHDRKDSMKMEGWVRKDHYRRIKVQDQDIMLFHYACRVWDKAHYGSWQLYGHSHGSLPDNPDARAIDVGVDCHDYKPLSFEQVQEIMKTKTFKPVDHHRGAIPGLNVPYDGGR